MRAEPEPNPLLGPQPKALCSQTPGPGLPWAHTGRTCGVAPVTTTSSRLCLSPQSWRPFGSLVQALPPPSLLHHQLHLLHVPPGPHPRTGAHSPPGPSYLCCKPSHRQPIMEIRGTRRAQSALRQGHLVPPGHPPCPGATSPAQRVRGPSGRIVKLQLRDTGEPSTIRGWREQEPEMGQRQKTGVSGPGVEAAFQPQGHRRLTNQLIVWSLPRETYACMETSGYNFRSFLVPGRTPWSSN